MAGFSANPEPFRLEPVFSPRIWGAKSLAPLFPEKSNLVEPIGEAWLSGVDCRIANGPLAGKTLGQAWQEMPAAWRGARFASAPDFPLLVKFIFPTDKLSIQVHPDDAYASVHEKAAGGHGKTEMWHIVSAEPGAQLLAGLKPGVTKESFLESLAGNILEDLLQAHPVHAGDTFFIPAGTPHSIGADMVVFEVQEYSDLTYRVYDYGRVDSQGKPRELHIEKALEVIRFGVSLGCKVPPLDLGAAGQHARLLCACPYFTAERLDFSERREFPADPAHFQLLAILAGRGNLSWPSGTARYHAGECWLLPASLNLAALHPQQLTAVLRAYVPDIASLPQRLGDAGIPASVISQSVFS
ncbi:MAG: type I phosphomannose isomerase catalytic subunit [Candidatus Acidiferrum sp.]